MSTIRAALSQTCNAYVPMPPSVDELGTLADRLDDIRQANIEHHIDLIEIARTEGAGVVGLGELFSAPYFALHNDEFWRGMAEDAHDGPTVSAMRETARRLEIVIIAPIYEKAADGRFNTAVVIDTDGSVLGRSRKVHIPQGRNEAGSFDERFYYEPSNGAALPCSRIIASNPFFPVFETAVGRIGVAICYDRHFESVMSTLARGGAQIIFSPAVTFGKKSRRMWDMEFEVDAVRHNVFIGGSNRSGAEQPWNQPYFGASHFVGPNGRLPDLSDDNRLIITDINLGELDQPDTSGWNLSRDARPDIY